MTVAFAAFSTNLRISGTASVPDTDWNIHFTAWQLDTQFTVTVGTNEQQNTAEYPTVEQLQKSLNPNITLVQGLNVTLKQPGDYAKYKFRIINEGSIDAELSSFSAQMTCTSGSGCDDVINYEVKCYDNENYTGSELTTHSVLAKTNGLAYCYLKVEYKDKTNQNSGNAGSTQTYSQDPITASLSASWQWIQKTNNGQSGNNSGNEQGNNEPETPSNPYETTFDGTYGYDYEGAETLRNGGSIEWSNTLNSNVTAYVRNDGSKIETCGVFGSGQAGTVCLTSSYYNSNYSSIGNYESDIEDVSDYYGDITTIADLQATGLKGYSLAKAEEMLTKGASSCDVDYDGYYLVSCHMTSRGGCHISYSGQVYCDDGNFDWAVYNDGSTDDHSAF